MNFLCNKKIAFPVIHLHSHILNAFYQWHEFTFPIFFHSDEIYKEPFILDTFNIRRPGYGKVAILIKTNWDLMEKTPGFFSTWKSYIFG